MNVLNWMSLIPDETNIKNINIPGAHDASTQFCQLGLFSSCQDLSIKEMLKIGVRAFDLRVNGENMVHSFTKCKKSHFGKPLTVFDVMADIADFLKSNPTETVLVFYKNDGKISGQDCLDLLKEKIINKGKSIWYLDNKFPCLNEVRGKIILLNRIDGSAGIDFSKMPYQGGTKAPVVQFFSPNGEDTAAVQDWYSLPRKRKWFEAVEPLLKDERSCEDKPVLNHLSSAGFPFIPKFNSAYINRKFSSFPLKSMGHYGIVMADFLSKEMAEKIIQSNF